MKKAIFTLCLMFCFTGMKAQNINGYIVSDTGNLTIIKVWGSHYERGFAYGYLCPAKILSMMNDYILPIFGSNLPLARQILQQGNSLVVDSIYYDEARGLLAGIDSAGYDISAFSYLDVIAANCLLDFASIAGLKSKFTSPGCSSLMSWSAATTGTDLNGKSVISRHLDWENTSAIINNQVIVIHIPSELNEQPWAMIGFAGQISSLSGVNAHIGVFQHMMSDFSGSGQLNHYYEPIWFSLRKAIETVDYNNDGKNNTNDLCSILSAHANGYADGYIISMLASANNDSSNLIAQVAEVTPASPYITFRGSEFPDSINSDNLYCANYEIKRNNHYHFCDRYIRTMHAVGSGTGISGQRNLEILRDSSNNGIYNIQFMQFIPDEGRLKISLHKHGKPAFMNPPVSLDLNDLFSDVSFIPSGYIDKQNVMLYPNPVKEYLHLALPASGEEYVSIEINDMTGKKISGVSVPARGNNHNVFTMDVDHLPAGIYVCRIISFKHSTTKIFTKTK
ncbi:MAG TPA: T9SS type A sorting domain-containing protein [Bacteroidales bacterium]|nr:T9SS type A sorting domain-containing protein [Bacteroidales bacterium]HQI69520.1 T9SS type A sorting domain-containing protein [Bacteroidales bacterium]